jgi:hypothetical protein
MFYETSLIIPPNTLSTAQATIDLPVHAGNVNRVEVRFPSRTGGLAHLRILYWQRQIWPSNPNSFFTDDGHAITFDEDLDLVDPPYVFTLSGWNEDDTFPHAPIVRIGILPFDRTQAALFARLGLGPTGEISVRGA